MLIIASLPNVACRDLRPGWYLTAERISKALDHARRS
jgi:hypothetical protein